MKPINVFSTPYLYPLRPSRGEIVPHPPAHSVNAPFCPSQKQRPEVNILLHALGTCHLDSPQLSTLLELNFFLSAFPDYTTRQKFSNTDSDAIILPSSSALPWLHIQSYQSYFSIYISSLCHSCFHPSLHDASYFKLFYDCRAG
jgi:hypothetical protein